MNPLGKHRPIYLQLCVLYFSIYLPHLTIITLFIHLVRATPTDLSFYALRQSRTNLGWALQRTAQEKANLSHWLKARIVCYKAGPANSGQLLGGANW